MGWFLAALTNTHLCQILDLGAMLMLGAIFQVIGHVFRVWRPPFALFTITFCLASLGQAYQDTHGNTFVAGVKGPGTHRWLAFIHAMYMAGCLVGPFVATGVASAGRWELFFCFPLGLAVLNLVFVAFAFRNTLRLKPRKPAVEANIGVDSSLAASRNESAMLLVKETLGDKNVWLLSLFYFFFLGATITASGWVVEYLVDVRNGDISSMGFVPAGFHGGAFLGRLLLAEPTHRFGVRRMICGYTIISIALQVLFWL